MEIDPKRLMSMTPDAKNKKAVKGVEPRPVLLQGTPPARHPAGKPRKAWSASKGHG